MNREQRRAQKKQSQCEIIYKDYHVLAPIKTIKEAIEILKGYRLRDVDIMPAVMAAIEARIVLMKSGVAILPLAHQNFCHDLTTWFANEIIEGRATLAAHPTTIH